MPTILYPDLNNKTAIITGVSRGIGYETCIQLLENNVTVYGISRTEATLLDIEKRYPNFIPIISDLTKDTPIILTSLPKIDILIHNAGFFEGYSIENMPLEIWNYHLNINLTVPFKLTQVLWDKLKNENNESSSIIFISSLAGVSNKEKFATTAAYTASKMGLVGLMEVIATEGKPHNIRANCISPGAVNTEMLRAAFPNMKADFSPNNITQAILYFASNISAPITGTNFVISV